MKKIVVGLGNPGIKFERTRHNVGFLFIDYLASFLSLKGFQQKKDGMYQMYSDLILLKPQTGMNLSGECIKRFVDWYKIDSENLLLIYDDFLLPAGDFSLRNKKTRTRHNGVLNVLNCLGTERLLRMRIGIGDGIPPSSSKDWVLQQISETEERKIFDLFEKLAPIVKNWGENKISWKEMVLKSN